MPKYQVGSFIYMVIGPLESSILPILFFSLLLFLCNDTLRLFSLLLIGILLLKPMNRLKPQIHIRTTMSHNKTLSN